MLNLIKHLMLDMNNILHKLFNLFGCPNTLLQPGQNDIISELFCEPWSEALFLYISWMCQLFIDKVLLFLVASKCFTEIRPVELFSVHANGSKFYTWIFARYSNEHKL